MNKKIKPQPGVTYECYVGYTDRMGTRVRKGVKYCYIMDSFREFWYMFKVSGKGISAAVNKGEFEKYFIPVNPLPTEY